MSTAPVRWSSANASTMARSTSETAIGWTLCSSQFGTGCTSSRVDSCRITSNDVDPAPITTPARRDTTDVVADSASSSTSSTSSRDEMCFDRSSTGLSGTSPERYTTRRTPLPGRRRARSQRLGGRARRRCACSASARGSSTPSTPAIAADDGLRVGDVAASPVDVLAPREPLRRRHRARTPRRPRGQPPGEQGRRASRRTRSRRGPGSSRPSRPRCLQQPAREDPAHAAHHRADRALARGDASPSGRAARRRPRCRWRRGCRRRGPRGGTPPQTSVCSSSFSGSWSKRMRVGSSKVITSVNVDPIDLPRIGHLGDVPGPAGRRRRRSGAGTA